MDYGSEYVIWGSSGHAKVAAEIINENGSNVVLLVDNDKKVSSCLKNVPIVYEIDGLRSWKEANNKNKLKGVVAIGGWKGNERQEIANLMMETGIKLPILIHERSVISKTASIGIGVHILANAVVSAGCIIGNMVILNNSSNIDHECFIGNGAHIAPGAIVCGCVSVDENAFIGAGAVVLPRIKIGKGSIIGAGTVVNRNVPDFAVVVGNPGRVIRKDINKGVGGVFS